MFPTYLLPLHHFFLDNQTPLMLYYIPLTASTSPHYYAVTYLPSQCMVRSNNAERAFVSHLERAQISRQFPIADWLSSGGSEAACEVARALCATLRGGGLAWCSVALCIMRGVPALACCVHVRCLCVP